MPEKRFIVFADPPTPNGALHVGHLSGPYFAADTFTRYLRLRGFRVAFLSNFDSNQPYVLTAGRRLGIEPAAVLEHFTAGIARSLAACDIEPDLVGSPDAHQAGFVERFFADLYSRGKLLVKEEEMPYCGTCERFLFEAYLQGTCPNCGATPCYGNGCESCALPNQPKDMGDRICRTCGEPPREMRTYRGLFLPLERYREELAAYLRSGASHFRQPVLDLVLPALDRPLPDIALSYVSDYGLPVTLPGFEGQIWNVRLEILPALIDTVDKWREMQGKEDSWDWRQSSDYEVVCFHGWENSFQYVVSFNSLLLASGLGFKLPAANLTNEFYLLDGKKFSTTRNHAVWGTDILSRVAADPLRFYLALTNPEVEQTDFVLADFQATTDRRLTAPWNEIHARIGAALARRGGMPATSPPVQTAALPAELAGRLDALATGLEAAYGKDAFSLRTAAALLADHLEWLAGHIAATLGPSGEPGPALSAALTAARALAFFAGPLMPRFATRLREALGPEGGWGSYRSPVDPGAVRWTADLALTPVSAADLHF
jgi:methionyl-tRNA synthetase